MTRPPLRPVLAAAASLACASSLAHAQLRIVNYNMLDKPATLTEPNVSNVRTVFGAIAAKSTNGIAKRPDLIMLEEQTIDSPANVATILNNLYGVNSYVAVTPLLATGLAQGTNDRVAFVYDTAAVNVVSPAASLPITNNAYPRPTIRIGVKPVGYASDDAALYVYGMHTKASTGTANEQQRALQLADTRADADQLGPNRNVIYTGDLNLYRAGEAAFQTMIASGNGQATDPLGPTAQAGSWNNNASFAYLHTQSTRLVTLADGGATGGVDDRFDLQMTSNALLGGEGLSYVGPTTAGSAAALHSYRPLGNNGNSFNKAINDPTNTAESAAVLEAIYQVSDHLPVFQDYQLPAKAGVALAAAVPTAVIRGANVTVGATVRNAANVTSVWGADELDYTVALSGSPTAAQSGTIAATGAAQTRTFALNTATAGNRSATLSVTTSSRGAEGAASQALAYAVLAPSRPSLAGGTAQTTSGTFDLGIVALGLSYGSTLGVYDLADPAAGAAFTAGLDVDAAMLRGDANFDAALPAGGIRNIAAGVAAALGVSFDATKLGPTSAVLTLATSDQDLPGAAARDTLTVSLTARGAIGGDADLSDTITFDDLLVVAQNFNAASGATWFTGDFTRDGAVNFDDLLLLAQNYPPAVIGGGGGSALFASDWALARSLVPEPTALAALVPVLLLRRKR